MYHVFPGDTFKLTGDTFRRDIGLDVKILSMVKYTSFQDMLEHEGLVNCLPDCPTIAAGVALYHNIPNYETLAQKLGVIALRITPDLTDATPLPRLLRLTRGGKSTHVLTRQEIQLFTADDSADKKAQTVTIPETNVDNIQHHNRSRSRSRERSAN